jgi:hypothetical protein
VQKMLGSEGGQVGATGDCRKQHNGELHFTICSSRMIELIMIRQAGLVARKGKESNA